MSDLSSDTLKQIEAAIRSRHNGRKLLRPADADTITLEQSLSRLPSFQADARGFFNAAVTLHPCTITADPRREDLVRELTEDDLAGGRGQEEASSFAESWYDMLQGMGVNVSNPTTLHCYVVSFPDEQVLDQDPSELVVEMEVPPEVEPTVP